MEKNVIYDGSPKLPIFVPLPPSPYPITDGSKKLNHYHQNWIASKYDLKMSNISAENGSFAAVSSVFLVLRHIQFWEFKRK